ncbi:MAG TPA: hypothetical protein VEI01_09920 [Terriglobales bacterium]|nr:hypothetical protein [Terriglobales bacterium]
MIPRLRHLCHSPAFLLGLTAFLGGFVVQSGDVGSADTVRRLQTTHSFWTSAPGVIPQDYPEFGVHGRNGKLYAWYGIGQSLLMLPADVVGTYLGKLPVFADYDDTDPTVRDIFVSYSINILLAVLTALVCFRFLLLLGFNAKQAVAGVLALLFCTTHLHYVQNMMENNYILFLTLVGLKFDYEWLLNGKGRALFLGSVAFGLNLLTRLTTVLDLAAGALFLVLAWGLQGGVEWRQRLVSFAKIAVPVYCVFLLLDRLYQYYRFGSFFNTYISVTAREQRLMDPSLPPNYPFETPFHVGFLGPLITPEKSIFLFDPLIVLTILLLVLAWKKFSPAIRAYLVSALALVLAYICFYARYTVWSGDSAWGDRYVSSAVELAAFISVPLLLRYHRELGRWVAGAGAALIGISALVQAASTAFWLPLERYQMETREPPTWVVILRFKNIAAFALGKMDQWGLTNAAMKEDPWDYVHITTWNFLPAVLRRVGVAPGWVVDILLGLLTAALGMLIAVLWRLYVVTRNDSSLTSERL